MERDIVKPPSVGMGVRRVPFVKGAGVPPPLFPLLNTFPAHSQTHCLSKGRTLVTAMPREPAGLRTGALAPRPGTRGRWGGGSERGARNVG